MKAILNRFSQPSSWAGLSGIAMAVGIAAPLYTSVSLMLAGACGIAAFVLNEKGA